MRNGSLYNETKGRALWLKGTASAKPGVSLANVSIWKTTVAGEQFDWKLKCEMGRSLRPWY